jgi:hypothetical protein
MCCSQSFDTFIYFHYSFSLSLVVAKDKRGAQAKFFQKGNGLILRGHNSTLEVPEYALDGGEEAELFGCYIVGPDRRAHRVGFAQGCDWSDHALENTNDYYFQQSKMRQCSLGPELVIGDVPFDDIEGHCSVWRRSEELEAIERRQGNRNEMLSQQQFGRSASMTPLYDSGPIFTGEKHMLYSLENLEDSFLRQRHLLAPGTVFIHAFGCSGSSWWSGPSTGTLQPRQWQYQSDDRIEIRFQEMGRTLVNSVVRQPRSSSVVAAVAMGSYRYVIT